MIKELFDKLRDSKELKTLFENFASLTILQIIGYVFPLLTLPYLSKTIGVSKFGVLAFANVIISYVATIVFFGFQYTAVRDVSRNRHNQNQLNIVVSKILYSIFLLLLFTIIVLIITIFYVSYLADYHLIILLTLLNVPAQVLNFDWFFQGMEKMKYFTIISFLSRFIYTISIFFVIKNTEDYIYIPILLAISTFASGIYAMYLVFVKFHIKVRFPGIINIVNTYKSGWSIFISQIAPNLYNSFSTIVLNKYFGDTSVGIYDAGRRVNSISEQLPIIFSKATFPYLSRKIEKHKLFMKINLSISFGISIFNLIFAEWIVKVLYTSAFTNSIGVIRILAFTPLAFSLVNGYGLNYLIQVGKERVFKNIVLLTSVLGFVLLFILVPQFNFYGAAATVISVYFLQGILCRFFAIKHQNHVLND